jgi:hypothetical protein
MSRSVEWGPVALIDLQRMHWRTAARVDEALQRFAASGEGTLRYVSVDGERVLRLYVAPYFAWITVTPEKVLVWRVLRYA